MTDRKLDVFDRAEGEYVNRVRLDALRQAVRALDALQAEVDRGEARAHWLDQPQWDVVEAARALVS